MRTTVTLDSDVEQIIRERMEAKGMSFKQALNDAIRDGVRGRLDVAFHTPVFDLGVGVDLAKANRIVGELDDAETVSKLRAGR